MKSNYNINIAYVFLRLIFLVVVISSCNNAKTEKSAPQDEDNIITEPVIFNKKYSDHISISSVYYPDEPKWKYQLEINYDGQIIYTEDSLKEFEFNNYAFPTFIEDSIAQYIIIERNDRPFPNQLDIYRIRNSQVDTIITIPLWSEEGSINVINQTVIENAIYKF